MFNRECKLQRITKEIKFYFTSIKLSFSSEIERCSPKQEITPHFTENQIKFKVCKLVHHHHHTF
jgi:hypothetical protein